MHASSSTVTTARVSKRAHALGKQLGMVVVMCGWLSVSACDSVLGLSKFSTRDALDGTDAGNPERACASNSDCNVVSKLASDSNNDVTMAGHCVTTRRRCASLLSVDCQTLTGPAANDDAILLGSLLATTGAQAEANLARQQSATLAIEEVNASGGIVDNAGHARMLMLLSCDAATDSMRAATHLFTELGISAVIGPDSSQDAVLLATKLAIPSAALMISPALEPANTADLVDDDLIWTTLPNDRQRASLLVDQIGTLETALRSGRDQAPLKLGMLVSQNAFGRGARASLDGLMFGGESLSSPNNLGKNVRIDTYDANAVDQTRLLTSYASFAADIIVILGMAEAVPELIAPLERAWPNNTARPHFVLLDSAKTTALLTLVSQRNDLAARIHGVGLRLADASRAANATFTQSYQQRFGSPLAALDAAGAYDATYLLAYALTANPKREATGIDLATSLRGLLGVDAMATVGKDGAAFAQLRTGQRLSLIGTLAPLQWDDRGAVTSGTIEVWCAQTTDGVASFVDSGRTLDIATQQIAGDYSACALQAVTVPVRTQAPAREPRASDAGSEHAAPQIETDTRTSHEAAGSPSQELDAGPMHVPDAGSPMPTRPIACGPSTCAADGGEYCCVSMLRIASAAPQPGDFSCASGPANCAATFHCTSDMQCGPNLVCCGLTSDAQCVAASDCAAKGGTRLACASARDCAPGAMCCARLGTGSLSYSSIECAADCQTPIGSSPLCEANADCVSPDSCIPSWILPPLKLCGLF